MAISNVIESWMNGKSMRSGGNVSTDGTHLFSYDLCIGKRNKRGLTVYDYRATSGNFISGTTSRHVGRTLNAIKDRGQSVNLVKPTLDLIGVAYKGDQDS